MPLLSAGWDNRPRYDNPVPWIPKTEDMLVRRVEEPTPTGLADHVRAGLDFVQDHPEACPARSLMLYAWNEHDWLCPTLDPETGEPDDSRIRAVGEAMRNWRPQTASGAGPE